MRTRRSLVVPAAFVAGVAIALALSVEAQPQPGTGKFTSVTTTSTGATSLTVGGGVTAGTGSVALVNTAGKIPALTTSYFADVSGSALTFPWSTRSYSGGTYTASGSMTWTVDSGDVGTDSYTVVGSMVTWTLGLNTTTVGGTTGGELRATLPGGFTAAGTSTNGTCAHVDNGTAGSGAWVVTSGNTYVSIYKDLNAASWTASTNATSIRCLIVFGK